MSTKTIAAAVASGLILASLAVLPSTTVLAQAVAPPASSTQTIPEKTPATDNNLKREAAPANTLSGRSGSLSTQLNKSNGVIAPKTDIDPGMKVPAPAAGAAVTPVVPPSATGGQDAK